MEAQVEKRGPGRPPGPRKTMIRGNSESALRAVERARQIRDEMPAGDISDRFYIDPSVIPDGFTYQWKRESTANQIDHVYQNGLRRRGWDPVPQERHPDIIVQQDGMILMELPTELVEERRSIERRDARNQVRTKEQQLGQAPKDTFARTGKLTKEFQPIEIESDE